MKSTLEKWRNIRSTDSGK